MSRFVVTGCAGFIGSHLVDRLLDADNEVIGVDSFSDYYARSAKVDNLGSAISDERFTLHEVDLAECDLEPLLAGVQGVFHLAAQPGVRGSWGASYPTYVKDNIVASQRIFEAATERHVKVVYASSSSVYGDTPSHPVVESSPCAPISPYGVTKLSCEHLADAYRKTQGLNAVGLRYFTVYGPRQRPDMAYRRIIGALLTGDVFTLFGDGAQSRDATYVSDVVEATICCMRTDVAAPVFNVGGGHELTIRQVIDKLEALAGRSLRLDIRAPADGDMHRTAADTQALRDATSWQPVTGIDAGLEIEFNWVRQTVDN